MNFENLGYTEKWLVYGILNESLLQEQLLEFKKGHDTNTEHYRYGTLLNWITVKNCFTEKEIENFIELALADVDKMMAGSAMKALFTCHKLNELQFEKIKQTLPAFGEWTGSLIQREVLWRRLNEEKLTQELFEECILLGDKSLLEWIINNSNNIEYISELSENGSSKRIRNLAKVMLKRIRKAANKSQ